MYADGQANGNLKIRQSVSAAKRYDSELKLFLSPIPAHEYPAHNDTLRELLNKPGSEVLIFIYQIGEYIKTVEQNEG